MPKFKIICRQELKVVREAPMTLVADTLDEALEYAGRDNFPASRWRQISDDLIGWDYRAAENQQPSRV